MKNVEITSSKAEAEQYLKRADEIGERLDRRRRKSYDFVSRGLGKRVAALARDYNRFRKNANKILRNTNIKEEATLDKISVPGKRGGSKIYIEEGEIVLDRVKTNCRKVKEICSKIEEVSLPEEEERELKQLQEDIEELKNTKFQKYAKDLEESLRAFRNTHFLGSALIAGRVLDVILDKLEGDSRSEKIEFLESRKILESKSGGKIVNAIKRYRNIYSHQVGEYPSLNEATIILVGTVDLVKRISEEKAVLSTD